MKTKRHYTVSAAVLRRNAKGGKATRKDEPRGVIPAGISTAVRLRRLVPALKRRELVDAAVNARLDLVEKAMVSTTGEGVVA